jgi:hypothetical protein
LWREEGREIERALWKMSVTVRAVAVYEFDVGVGLKLGWNKSASACLFS